jgi:hypothetical protein
VPQQGPTSASDNASGDVPFARLQLEPGLYGVTKVRWRTWPHRTWLSWLLAAVYLAIALTLTYNTAHHHAEPRWFSPVKYGVTFGWVLLVVGRLILEGTVSKPAPGKAPPWDRQIVDPWWTTIHTLTGVVLGLWLVPLLAVVAVTIGWEVLEIAVPGYGDEEINGNRLTDIGVAWAGWLIGLSISAAATGWLVPIT